MNRAALWIGALATVAIGIGVFAWRSLGTTPEIAVRPVAPASEAPAPTASAAPAAVPLEPPPPVERQPATVTADAPLADRMAAFPQGLLGQVVDLQGRPLAGTRIYLVESARNEPLTLPMLRQQGLLMGPVAETPAGADGTFALGLALASDKLYELRLVAPGFADLRIGDLRVLPGEWHDIGQVSMVPGTTVRGRVTVAGTSTPVPQAIVAVEASNVFEDAVLQAIPGRERGLCAVAGSDGTYTIENAPAHGVVQISAAAAGFARVIRHDLDLSGQAVVEADFALPPGLTITGQVVDERRRAIAHARVEAWPADAATPPIVDQSRVDGTFELVGLTAGPHRLRVLARGYQDQNLDNVEAGTRGVRFELRPRASIAVRVTGGGRVLRSYRLGVRRYVAAPEGGAFQIVQLREVPDHRVRLDGMTDRFTVAGLPAGEFVVQVSAEGHAKTLSSPFTITEATTSLDVDLAMTPGGTLRGRVVGEDGAPLAGATVVTQSNGARPDDPVWRMIGRGGPERITPVEVRTGADGSFVLRQLAYGDYQLEVSHEGACRRYVRDLTVAGPEEHDLGTIRLLEGTLVFGRATVDGRVARQVKVMLTSVVAPDAPPEVAAAAVRLETVTDSTGAFALPRRVPPGEYEIRAAAVDATDPDAQVFRHLLQMQRSATKLNIAAGQRHYEHHIDVSDQH